MKPFSLLIVGAVFCIVYLECCSASISNEIPSPVVNSPAKTIIKAIDENKKQTNGSALIHPKILRAKRQACRYQEHWTHRCRNDCECSRKRYCSSYGFCQAKARARRQDENDILGYGY